MYDWLRIIVIFTISIEDFFLTPSKNGNVQETIRSKNFLDDISSTEFMNGAKVRPCMPITPKPSSSGGPLYIMLIRPLSKLFSTLLSRRLRAAEFWMLRVFLARFRVLLIHCSYYSLETTHFFFFTSFFLTRTFNRPTCFFFFLNTI